MKVIYFNSALAPMCDPPGHGNEQRAEDWEDMRWLSSCDGVRGQQSWQRLLGQRQRRQWLRGQADPDAAQRWENWGKGKEYRNGSKQRVKVRKQGEGLGTSGKNKNKTKLKEEQNTQRKNPKRAICILANAAENRQQWYKIIILR